MRTPAQVDSSQIVAILNQLFILENKLIKLAEGGSMLRNVDRIKEEILASGYSVESLLGQRYDETRTDCEASIAGGSTENLTITDVVKPLIRYRDEMESRIVQRAVVIVQGGNSI